MTPGLIAPVTGLNAPVIVVGGGISGIACARRLQDSGIPVVVTERSHRLGGRMAARTEDLGDGPRPVDIGAPYFVVRDEGFRAVADGWAAAGLLRPWTDTFILATPDGRIGATSKPLRWAATAGMRALAEDLASGLEVRLEHEVRAVTAGPDGALAVDGEPASAVVLAMPDPQAVRLLPEPLADRLGVTGRSWTPALSVWSIWRERWWPEFDAAFVDGSKVLSAVFDHGRSRGDGAAVLVAHTTGDFAAAHLDSVDLALGPVLDELPRVLGSGAREEPRWARVHRWSLASSRHPHPDPYALVGTGPDGAGPLLAACGDAWGERSRVEQAWLSGDSLGEALARAVRDQAGGEPAGGQPAEGRAGEQKG